MKQDLAKVFKLGAAAAWLLNTTVNAIKATHGRVRFEKICLIGFEMLSFERRNRQLQPKAG